MISDKDITTMIKEDVDKLYKDLGDLYTASLWQLENFINDLGGTLVDFSPSIGMIDIDIEGDAKDAAFDYIIDTIAVYNKKRAEILKEDPFYGIKSVLVTEMDD